MEDTDQDQVRWERIIKWGKTAIRLIYGIIMVISQLKWDSAWFMSPPCNGTRWCHPLVLYSKCFPSFHWSLLRNTTQTFIRMSKIDLTNVESSRMHLGRRTAARYFTLVPKYLTITFSEAPPPRFCTFPSVSQRRGVSGKKARRWVMGVYISDIRKPQL